MDIQPKGTGEHIVFFPVESYKDGIVHSIHTVEVDKDIYEQIKCFKWRVRKDSIVACTSEKIKDRLLHRFVANPTENQTVDHKDTNRLNNTRKNLRCVTNQHNCMNMSGKKSARSKTKYKGVSWKSDRGKWHSRIMFNYKEINLGGYDTSEAAAKAYDEKARELYGSYATYNFPLEGERSAV